MVEYACWLRTVCCFLLLSAVVEEDRLGIFVKRALWEFGDGGRRDCEPGRGERGAV